MNAGYYKALNYAKAHGGDESDIYCTPTGTYYAGVGFSPEWDSNRVLIAFT